MDSVKEGIRLNLIELFEVTGKKQIDLAAKCGVGRSAVSNWISGDTSIDVERIPAICEFFGISVSKFFGRSEELESSLRLSLSSDEESLIEMFRACDERQKSAVLEALRSFLPNC